MICGCCKDLGCFTYNSEITFPFKSDAGGDYIFHIWSNGSYSSTTVTFGANEDIVLPFTFNENSETTIKVELPAGLAFPEVGICFATTKDGACCFTVNGLVSTCS